LYIFVGNNISIL